MLSYCIVDTISCQTKRHCIYEAVLSKSRLVAQTDLMQSAGLAIDKWTGGAGNWIRNPESLVHKSLPMHLQHVLGKAFIFICKQNTLDFNLKLQKGYKTIQAIEKFLENQRAWQDSKCPNEG